MSTVVMERVFEQPPTDEQLQAMKERTEVCLEINSATRLKTYASEDRGRFVCIFDGPDLETVRRAIESAGVDYESMWTATVF